MLLIVFVVALLSGLGLLLVTATAGYSSKRLGLDLWEAAVWLGLAEAPVDGLAARRSKPVAVRSLLASSERP